MPNFFVAGLLSVVLLVRRVVLVYGIVRQVHIQVVHVFSVGFAIGFRSEPRNAFLVDVYS